MGALAWLLVVGGLYLFIGALFAPVFVVVGAPRMDPAARGASWGFRLIVLPGVAALWPVMVAKWARAPGGGP